MTRRLADVDGLRESYDLNRVQFEEHGFGGQFPI
jgi:hypothetical protein